jgi:hypothetical protein
MSGSRPAELVRDVSGKGLIVVGIAGALLTVVLGALQIELISSDGDFARCGAVWRPLTAEPAAAAAACADAIGQNALWMTFIAITSAFALVGGIVLRASVPKRLQHRR